jgi:hypothetical protein
MRSLAIATVAALCALAVGAAGCGSGKDRTAAQRPVVRSVDSSWIPGQISMAELAAFQTISGPALKFAQERAQQRKRELALLEAQRIAARKKARDDARRKYQEALRRAREKYRLALKKAAEERRRKLAELRRKKAEIERRRRELEEKLKVRPGEECQDAQARRRYRCSTGRLPVPSIPRR